MDQTRIDELLARTLDDGSLSRGDRTALGAIFEELTDAEVALVRSRVFALARERSQLHPGADVLSWCEAVLQLLGSRTVARLRGERDVRQEAWFSPDDACARRIVEAIDGGERAIDVCVYTLTDDRLAAALLGARARGVTVRVITDDEKSSDLGSDAVALMNAGIAVRMDRTLAHMHHKFALFDDRTVLTGSYNWTRSADRDNRENFVVSDDPVLLRRFRAQFEQLWAEFRP